MLATHLHIHRRARPSRWQRIRRWLCAILAGRGDQW